MIYSKGFTGIKKEIKISLKEWNKILQFILNIEIKCLLTLLKKKKKY